VFARLRTSDGWPLSTAAADAGTVVRWAPAAVVISVVGPLAAGNGGYFPPSWGWSAAALLWAAAVALILRSHIDVPWAGAACLTALMALAGWTLVSQVWSAAGPAVLESERCLVYIAGLGAILAVSRRGDLLPVLLGLVLAISAVCLYGLAGRLVPDWGVVGSDTGRMQQPVGYWNGLGILAAMAVLVAIGTVAHARPLAARVIAAATLPVALTTVYFTFSRGAWLSLAFGLLVALAVDRRRSMLVLTIGTVAPLGAVLLAVAARSSALTHTGSALDRVTAQGHRLGAVLVTTMVVLGLAATVLHRVDARWRPSARVTLFGWSAALGVVLVVVAVSVSMWGSPASMGHKLYGAFNGRARAGQSGTIPGEDLNKRLFSLSGNSRATLWRIAWHDVQRHPLVGSGGGTYERVYLQHRTTGLKVTDAHNLYLETLAELGLVGLALLAAGLLIPVWAGVAARANPLVPAAMGAYSAALLHAMVDWDWELPAVMLAAVCLAGALMMASHRSRSLRVAGLARPVAGAVVLVLLVAALAGLQGNTATADSADAGARGDWHAALSSANTAVSWAPWSAAAWVSLGDARQALRRPGGLAAYRHAARLDPGDWATWFAIARGTSGRTREQALARAERLNPRGKAILTFRMLLGNGP
jgi:hypothetical protein